MKDSRYAELTIPPYNMSDEELFKARKEFLAEMNTDDINYSYLYMITAISAAIHDWGTI